MGAEHGYRYAELQPHCGICVYYKWEESVARCEHPAFVEYDTVVEVINDLEPEDRQDCELAIAMRLYESLLDNYDFQEYGFVCDLYKKGTNGGRVYDKEILQLVEEHVIPMIEKAVKSIPITAD